VLINPVPFTACIYYYNPQKSRLNIIEGCFKSKSEAVLPRPLYIIISRVKILAGFLFEIPFDFDRFVFINSAISRDRKLDYTFRNI
jgi:hypothetical protein